MITQAQLKAILHYNLETGIFTWAINRGTKMKAGDIAGTINKKGYVMIYYQKKCYISHRLAWLFVNGHYPDQIDHIDGNRSNNIFSNLRQVNGKDNCKNIGVKKSNKSGVMGVHYSRNRKRWVASITNNGKFLSKGYLDFNDAVIWRKEKEHELGFHQNHGKRESFRI